MNGESDGWHHLAERLGMSLQRVKRETTSTEFVAWMIYFNDEVNHPTRQDHYLAQIAFEVHRANSSKPNSVTLKDFLLKPGKPTTTKPLTEEEKELRMQQSKAFWMQATGVLNNGGNTPAGNS